ncbi:unnamed protein product [Acanthoscelides obtectus]|uniref:Uncharacterized protein n=1 Tax=Acanthoscelides obtectus TaxID=200917 RepID=A0A9P0P5A7_ACAOB|nr:unnamed protein product [Acanthoscelides obtectus]CAK1666597.1 hypothetical protein AOBTE_LOCUS25387 [Acanthoscelides obtectus]
MLPPNQLFYLHFCYKTYCVIFASEIFVIENIYLFCTIQRFLILKYLFSPSSYLVSPIATAIIY